MAEHKHATGHTSESDKGRFRVQLNDVFSRSFLSEFDEKLTQNPEVKSSSSLALPQVVQTHIWFHDEYAGKQLIEYELVRKEYEFLINKFDKDKHKVFDYYTDEVTALIEKAFAQSTLLDDLREKPESKTYQISALNYQIAEISPWRYWLTKGLSIILYLILAGLVIRNLLNS